jgi:predicted Zn-dependent protease
MPGGKIVIYSGILPITKDDAGLANVMGHVSHALTNHGAQTYGGQLQQVIGAGVSVATSGQSEKHNKYGIKLMVLVHK